MNIPSPGPTLLLLWLGLQLLGCNERRRPVPERTSYAGQTLRLYNFANYLGPEVLSAFSARTGAQVSVVTYESNEEMLRRVESGADFDVVFPSCYAVERLRERGLLADMLRESVPNLIHVQDRFRNPPVDPGLRHCAPFTWHVVGLGVRSNRALPGRDPDSMDAVFAPGGGPLVLQDDLRGVVGMALRALGYSANSRAPAELARAQALLQQLRPRVVAFVPDVGQALQKSQAPLGLGWSGDIMEVARHNKDVRFITPREGTLLYVDYACVLERSPRKALAFEFLNHLLEPQMGADISNSKLYAAPNTGAQRLLQPDAQWLWGTLDALKSTNRFEMLRDVGEATPRYEALWRAVRAP